MLGIWVWECYLCFTNFENKTNISHLRRYYRPAARLHDRTRLSALHDARREQHLPQLYQHEYLAMFSQPKVLGNCQPTLAQHTCYAVDSQAVRRIRICYTIAKSADTFRLSCVFLLAFIGNEAFVLGDLCSIFDAQSKSLSTRFFLARAWLWHDLRLGNDEPLFPLEIHRHSKK